MRTAHLRGSQAPLALQLRPPGDKSLSHRALMLAALARGSSRIWGLLDAADVRATRAALVKLGAHMADAPDGSLLVTGGLAAAARAHEQPCVTLECGNSGTSMRLLLGLCAGLGREALLVGDASLSRRPMARVLGPLAAMGASFEGGPRAPVRVLAPATAEQGLVGQTYALPIASGQVKAALLLAGLSARGTTRLTGALGGRDHTERMLQHFGATLVCGPHEIVLEGPQQLTGQRVDICGDVSAAAFWLAAAALVPRSTARLEGVGLNPTRLGFVRLLVRMGGDVSLVPARTFAAHEEPAGDIVVRQQDLRGVDVAPSEVAALIDELPLVAVLATQAHGTTTLCGAAELRHKESDRIAAICAGLLAMGADIRETPDGFVVHGPTPLAGCVVDSSQDHRIAMALSIAALIARGTTQIVDSGCVDVSYPDFYRHYPAPCREEIS